MNVTGRAWRSPIWRVHHAPNPRPSCAAISFRDIAAQNMQAAHSMVALNTDDNSWFQSALTSCLTAAASRLRRPVAEVRWFCEMCYEVLPGHLLSYSDDFSSPECILSGSLAVIGCNIESMMLDAEHCVAEASVGAQGPVSDSIALRTGEAVNVSELKAGVREFVENPPNPQLCLLYTSPSPRDRTRSRMPSSA